MDSEDLKSLLTDLDYVVRSHRDVLDQEPRILNPLQEARDAAKTRYDDARLHE